MDKFAQIKEAEVRGVLAACVDAGILKVANEEQFDALSSATASYLEPDYDVNAVIKTAADVLNYVSAQQAPAQEKTASEQNYSANMAALGELLLMKTAGQIDDATFQSNAAQLIKQAADPAAAAAAADPGMIAKLKALLGSGYDSAKAGLGSAWDATKAGAGAAADWAAGKAGALDDAIVGKVNSLGDSLVSKGIAMSGGEEAAKAARLMQLGYLVQNNPRLLAGLAGAGTLGAVGGLGAAGYGLYDYLKEASDKCAEGSQCTDNNGQPACEVGSNLPRKEEAPKQDPTSIHPEVKFSEKQASLADILLARHK